MIADIYYTICRKRERERDQKRRGLGECVEHKWIRLEEQKHFNERYRGYSDHTSTVFICNCDNVGIGVGIGCSLFFNFFLQYVVITSLCKGYFFLQYPLQYAILFAFCKAPFNPPPKNWLRARTSGGDWN
jgi:hypothetical protein